MSGQSCNVFPTATQYGTSRSVVYQTNVYSTQVVSNNATLQYPVTVISSYTSASVYPTGTLYGTSCNAVVQQTSSAAPVVATSSSAAAAAATTSAVAAAAAGAQASSYAPSTSAAIVQTEQSVQTNPGGDVETRTVIRTISGSVALVTQTASSNSTASGQTTNNDGAASNTPASQPHTGLIAGGIVIAVVVIAFLGFLGWCIRKRRKRARDTRNLDDYFNDPTSAGWRPEEGQDAVGSSLSRRGSAFLVGSLSRRRSEQGVLDLEQESRRSNEKANWAELVEDDTFLEPTADEMEEITEIPNGRPERDIELSPPSRAASPRSLTGAARSRPGSIRERAHEAHAAISSPRTVSFGSGEAHQLSPRLRPLSEFQGIEADWENALTTSPPMSPSQHLSPEMGEAAFQSLPSRQGIKSRSMSGLSVQVPERPASALGLASTGTAHRSAAGGAVSYGPSPPHSPQGSGGPGSFAQSPSRRGSTLRMTPNRAGSVTYGNLYPLQHWQGQQPHKPSPQRVSTARSFSGDIYPPSRYAHLDIVHPDDAVQTEDAAQASSAKPPVHARTVSTGSLQRPTSSPIAPRPALTTGGSGGMHGSSSYVIASPRQSFFVVGGTSHDSAPERSRSVLSIRNAAPEDELASTAGGHNDYDAMSPGQPHYVQRTTSPSPLGNQQQAHAAPLVQRDDSNASSGGASATSAVSAAPSTPLTPYTPDVQASAATSPSSRNKDPLSRAGSIANGSAPQQQSRSSWSASNWLTRGSSIVRS